MPQPALTRLDTILASALSRLGLERDLDDYRVWQAWDEVVGRPIARNAQPVRLDGRRLVVVVRSSAWMQELSYLQRELVERINTWMGREVIGEIFLVVGRVPRPEDDLSGQKKVERARKRPVGAAPEKLDTPGPPEIRAAFERLWAAARGAKAPRDDQER